MISFLRKIRKNLADEDILMQSIQLNKSNQNELSNPDISKILGYYNDIYGNGLDCVLLHRESVVNPSFLGFIPIPNTHMLMIINYPIDSMKMAQSKEVKLSINSELSGPRVFIVDTTNGLVKYSNWCDEFRTGSSRQNNGFKLIGKDVDGDGITDFYTYNLHHIDSELTGAGETTLTNTQVFETEKDIVPDIPGKSDKKVKIRWKAYVKDGFWGVDIILDGVFYSNTNRLDNRLSVG